MVSAVVALATAARGAGVTHLRLRQGPVAELVLLPADPPMPQAPSEDAEGDARLERELRLRGGGAP